MAITIKQVGTVKNARNAPEDDHWSQIISEIELADDIPTEAFDHIADFSHLEIIFFFDQAEKNDIVFAGRPRGNPDYPLVGIFAQRKKDRPNSMGLCTVELLEHKGRVIRVRNLDAINGSPVIDIKPVFKEFQPPAATRQPPWVSDLMKNYWE